MLKRTPKERHFCWENINLSLFCYAPSSHLLGKKRLLNCYLLKKHQSLTLWLCCKLSFVGKRQSYALLLRCKLSFVGKTPIFCSVATLQVVICWENANRSLCCSAPICYLLGKRQSFALLPRSKLSFVGKTPIFRSVATFQVVICWPHIAAHLRAFRAEFSLVTL